MQGNTKFLIYQTLGQKKRPPLKKGERKLKLYIRKEYYKDKVFLSTCLPSLVILYAVVAFCAPIHPAETFHADG